MDHFWRNFGRLLAAGVLIIPQTFWINRLRYSSTRWPEYFKGDYNLVTVAFFAIDALFVIYLTGMIVTDMLAQRSNASSLLKNVSNKGLALFLLYRFRSIRSSRKRSAISFTLSGIVILFFIIILSTEQVFDSRSIQFYDHIAIQRMQSDTASEAVYYFNYVTGDDNNEKYLHDILKMSKDFNDVGVKAIVADWPVNIHAYDSLSLAIIDTLMRNYNVIFADYPRGYTTKFLPPKSHYAAAKFPLGFPIYSAESSWGREDYLRTIVKWYPFRVYRSFGASAGVSDESDVALFAAGKYFNGRNDSMVKNHYVVVNDCRITGDHFTIPVTPEGAAYSKLRWDWLRHAPVSATRDAGGWEARKNGSGTLVYHFQIESDHGSYPSMADTLKNLRPYRKYFDGKVVFVDWIDESNSRSTSFIQKFSTASIINSAIQNEYYRKSYFLMYLFIVVSLVVLGIAVGRFAIVAGFSLSILLLAGVIVSGTWLFLSERIIIDFLYPVAAIVLSFMVFSLLKLAHETDS